MELFKISSGSTPAKVKLENEDGKLIENISVGELGRGRSKRVISIIGDGHELRAKKTEDGIVLVRGEWPAEDRCLAVINTVGGYDRYRSYGLFDAQGIEVLTSGYIAFGLSLIHI